MVPGEGGREERRGVKRERGLERWMKYLSLRTDTFRTLVGKQYTCTMWYEVGWEEWEGRERERERESKHSKSLPSLLSIIRA